MTLTIEDASPDDVAYVASKMRDSDFRELSALLPVTTRFDMVKCLIKRYSHIEGLIVARNNGMSVAVGGAFERSPNVCTLFMYATPEFPKIGYGLTRFVKKQLMARLVEAGVHRFECVSIEGHTDAHKWIRTLGLTEETELLRNYGKNKESFIQFSRVIND